MSNYLFSCCASYFCFLPVFEVIIYTYLFLSFLLCLQVHTSCYARGRKERRKGGQMQPASVKPWWMTTPPHHQHQPLQKTWRDLMEAATTAVMTTVMAAGGGGKSPRKKERFFDISNVRKESNVYSIRTKNNLFVIVFTEDGTGTRNYVFPGSQQKAWATAFDRDIKDQRA